MTTNEITAAINASERISRATNTPNTRTDPSALRMNRYGDRPNKVSGCWTPVKTALSAFHGAVANKARRAAGPAMINTPPSST